MRIARKRVGEDLTYEDFGEITLKDMQDMVGGHVECLRLGNGVDCWLNEEGKLLALPANFAIGDTDKREVWDVICGDVFFASSDDEGNTIGLEVEQINYIISSLYTNPHVSANTPNGLVFVPLFDVSVPN